MVSVLAMPHAGQVIVDSRITVISLKHRADVGGARRVGEDRLLQIVGGKVMAQRETKEVDDFIGMWADEMGAEDAPAALFDQRFESVHRLGDTARRVPIRHLLAFDLKFYAPRPRLALAQAHGGDRWQREGDARYAAIVGSVPIAFEKIARDHLAVMA